MRSVFGELDVGGLQMWLMMAWVEGQSELHPATIQPSMYDLHHQSTSKFINEISAVTEFASQSALNLTS